jgi:hypothetical protein
MKFAFLLLSTLMVLSVAPAYAVEELRSDAQPVQKSVKDMTQAERKAYWNTLPAEQKQRILERRKQMMAKRRTQGEWEERTSVKNRPSETTFENLTEERQAAAKARWEAMTPEQKAEFVDTYKAQIKDGMKLRGAAGE